MLLCDEHQQKLQTLEALTTKLSSLSDIVGREEEMELAYIIRGSTSMVSKMNSLIQNARGSLLIFIPDNRILKEIESATLEAAMRGVRVDAALAENVKLPPTLKRLLKPKQLDCLCCLLVADNRTLLNFTNWSTNIATAILTQEPSMIRFTREYYNNPRRCRG